MIIQILTPLLIVLGLFAFPSATELTQDRTTYDEVLAGMRSFQNEVGDLEFDYQVGSSLHFGIVSPGQPNRSIYFYAASFEGDYFAVVNISDECVVVRPGQSAALAKRVDLAFVSTRNGKVYRTLEELRTGK